MILAFGFAPPIFSGDYDTARNYLSTIAATLATILALCISIVLVAIQMTASKYSPRVLDFFIRLPYNASLLSLYLATIFHSIYTLSKVEHQPGGVMPLWLDRAMSADLFLLGCCLLVLISYLFAVLRLMKPETILLAIEKEYVSCYRRGKYENAIDKLEQIADIGKRSLADLDTTTGHLCLVTLANVLNQTRVPTEAGSPLLWYHRKVIRLLLSLASIAYEKREVTVSSSVLDELEQIGKRYVNAGSIPGVTLLADSYSWIITNNLLGSQQQDVIKRVIDLSYELICGILMRDFEGDTAETFRFTEDTLGALHQLGQRMVQTEYYGGTLSVELFLTDRFSDVISLIYQKTHRRKWAEEIAFSCAVGYLTLFSVLEDHLKPRDMILVTTWIRSLLITDKTHTKPHLRKFYKRLFILQMAITLSQGRRDLFSIALRSIGQYEEPQISWFNELLGRKLQIRRFFHYREPEPYLREVYELWLLFKKWVPNPPSHTLGIVTHVLGDEGEERALLEQWPELFDSL